MNNQKTIPQNVTGVKYSGNIQTNWRSKALPREVKPSTSLCIPRMEASVSRDYIYSVFNKLNIGHIDQLNEIPLRNERDFKRVLLRIRLNNSDTANTVGRFLKEKGYVNIVHDMPWFWKLVPAGNPAGNPALLI